MDDKQKVEAVKRVIDIFMKDPDPAYAYDMLCNIDDLLKDRAEILDNGMVVRYTSKTK